MKTNSKIFLFISCCVLVLLALQSLNIGDNERTMAVIDSENNDGLIDNPKTAGNWNLEAIILVDDSLTGVGAQNWSWAVAQAWCSGAGTEGDPFLFENITITVDDASAGLAIRNSNSTTYFELNNITIVNANGDGLELSNVTNGVVGSSNFSLCGDTGLSMVNVNNTVIGSTYCLNNTVDGICAIDCNNVNFTVDCSNNGQYGLILSSCVNNTVILSQFIDNVEIGVVINEIAEHSLSEDNVITENTFEGNLVENGLDNSTEPNDWDGNEWDDYGGADKDDDGIGDTPYDISGSAGAEDALPVFSDGTEPPATPHNGGNRDLWEEMDPITQAIFVGIFFGIFIGILVISKFLQKIF